jgi:hypothetical protein
MSLLAYSHLDSAVELMVEEIKKRELVDGMEVNTFSFYQPFKLQTG